MSTSASSRAPVGTGGAVLNRSRSFWWNSSAPYVPSESLTCERHVDICIVGGGINGVSCAYHLRSLDNATTVALLEAEVVGYGASGRNAGQIITKFGGTTAKSLVGNYGAERAGFAWNYIHSGMKIIEGFAANGNFDFDYRPTGALHAALRIDGDAELAKTFKLMERMGQSQYFTFVSEGQIHSELGSPYIGSALYDSRGGQFNPLKLVRGIKKAAEALGAEIYENSPAAFIEVLRHEIVVHTGSGRIRCKKLVVATNAYMNNLGGVTRLGLAREQSPLIVKATVTAPLTPEQWEALGWPRRSGINILSPMFYSFAPTADGRIIHVGGYHTHAPKDGRLGPEVEFRLKEVGAAHLASFFPKLAGIQTAQTWGGPISITPDHVPHIGLASDPRILYACGCWGNGMPCGTQNGLTLAELALERSTDNTQAWFVQRRKRLWPGPIIAAFLAGGVILKRKQDSRRIGKTLSPPLIFR
jgi:glycine/D-amino acid oxidase-like deaminating enzyme